MKFYSYRNPEHPLASKPHGQIVVGTDIDLTHNGLLLDAIQQFESRLASDAISYREMYERSVELANPIFATAAVPKPTKAGNFPHLHTAGLGIISIESNGFRSRNNIAELGLLAVKMHERGQGVGAVLVDHLLSEVDPDLPLKVGILPMMGFTEQDKTIKALSELGFTPESSESRTRYFASTVGETRDNLHQLRPWLADRAPYVPKVTPPHLYLVENQPQ